MSSLASSSLSDVSRVALSQVVMPPTALPLAAGADDSALVLLLEQAASPVNARAAAPSAAAVRIDVFTESP
jgi:hypothetical protein